MASTLTSEQVRSDLERARALLTKTEEDFHRGTVEYERLAAVQQELRFREGLLEAVTKREARREREAAEKEAKAKALADRRERAQATIKNTERTITAVENYKAATLDLHDACTNQGIKTLDAAFAATISTLRNEVKGPVAGDLNALQYQFRPPIGHLEQLRQQLEAAKTELAEASQTKEKVA